MTSEPVSAAHLKQLFAGETVVLDFGRDLGAQIWEVPGGYSLHPTHEGERCGLVPRYANSEDDTERLLRDLNRAARLAYIELANKFFGH